MQIETDSSIIFRIKLSWINILQEIGKIWNRIYIPFTRHLETHLKF